MKILENFKLICISMLFVVGLAACDKPKPGPAETAGKEIDQAMGEAGKKIEQVTSDAGKKIGEAVDKAAMAISDAEITTMVKAAIFSDPDVEMMQISVDTVNGVVTLSGSVDSQSSSDRAKELADAVDGVKEVENHLVIESSK
ncbi:MAG: BON domain-containing protein [Nitrosomonas sp.]|nr:BON domain-containing protein [Nitrosomonas sp.]MDP1949974.1 BON domain-containing protein [Nitrosomonas sp.]